MKFIKGTHGFQICIMTGDEKMNNNKGKILATMVCVVMFAAVFAAVPVNVYAATIIVPDDYPTIQQAIDAASSSDTVYVCSGTYYEQVTIGKSLTLEGEDRNTTIIDAGGTGNAIHLTADYVTIRGVTATNGQFGLLLDDVGIGHAVMSDCIMTSNTEDGIHGRYMEECIIIENCELSYNGGAGLWAHHCDNSVIRNCQAFENGYDSSMPHRVGLDIAWCHDSSIVDCDVYSNMGVDAIVLDATRQCVVEGCNVWDNDGIGIDIYAWGGYGYNHTIRDNVVENNGTGIGLTGGIGQGYLPHDNLVYHNDIISNGVQAVDYGYDNEWDNGSGGNYWSDYTGVDSDGDGIGDTPYVIAANAQDNYPLIDSLSIILLAPNGGEKIKGGSVYDITWNTSESRIDHIRLLYSTDSGNTYPNTIVASTDGTYEWTTPEIDFSTVRVKAIAEDASNNALADDESDADFTIDSTAPETTATLSGTQGENGWYTSDVTVELSATDDLSGVKETKYKINSGVWETYSEPFTVSGSTVYYQSEDNAGNLEAEKSQLIKIDKTSPSTPVVTDDGDSTPSKNQLHALWTAEDGESGIVEYQYAIGTTEGGNDVVGWTSTGTETEVTATGLSLTDRRTYYFSVKAKNGAGIWSEVGVSDGIMVITSPRTIHVATTGDDATGDGSEARPYRTIQKGIDEASDGDTVLVADGTYTGEGNKNLDFKRKAITVTSENGAEPTIIDCEEDGRGFYFHSGETEESVVSGFTITNGFVTGDGGGIACNQNSSPTIQNNIIEENSATHEGGGIFCRDNCSPTITNNIITRNSAWWGGGIFLGYNSYGTIQNNTIEENSADVCGGGIVCRLDSCGTIQNNAIEGNSAHLGGGIVCYQNSSPIIQNNTIEKNSATNDGGGGIYCAHNSSPTIQNNTIEGNSATHEGGGIYCYSSSPTVLNTILWADSPGEIYVDETSEIDITYSDVQGGWEGEGNIDADPMFVDADGGDYHLQPGSPCIDAGDPDSPKDPDGTRADMGALYSDQSGPVPTSLEKVSGDNQIGDAGTVLPEPLVVMLKDQNANPMAEVEVDFTVTQGNGSVNPTSALTDVDGKASTEFTLGQTAGLNQVTATVNELSVTFSATGQAQLLIIYVDDDAPPGGDGSKEHPFNNIQDGIDAAEDIDTVLVADGTYTGYCNKNLDFKGKAITVTSENGAESTIIDCEEDGRGFSFHSGENESSVVRGFTITNGSPFDGHGGGICCANSSSPTIESNIITGNSSAGIYIVESAPIIQNNIIKENEAGGGIRADRFGGVIQNNVISGNSADFGAGIHIVESFTPIIQNNEIIGNSARRHGGGIFCFSMAYPTIINNTISGNSASENGGGISCENASSPMVLNTILWENSPD